MQEGVLCADGLCESGQMGPSSHRPRRKLGQAATRSGSWIALQICPFRHRPILVSICRGYYTLPKTQEEQQGNWRDMAFQDVSRSIYVLIRRTRLGKVRA